MEKLAMKLEMPFEAAGSGDGERAAGSEGQPVTGGDVPVVIE